MLTEREQEILKLIEENPLMSQEELAVKTGITRSSVAVHISNLMKKGAILGKGYVLQKQPYAAIIGGAGIDISGYPDNHLIRKDSPGRVENSFGGTGRNIAHNLRMLQVDAKMLTLFGEDMYAEKLKENCRGLGIDITYSPVIPNGATPIYLSVMDSDGGILFSISEYSQLYAGLTPQMLEARMNVINHSKVCFAEADLRPDSIMYLAQNCQAPLFISAASDANMNNIRMILDKIYTLKINPGGIEAVLQCEIRTEQELYNGIEKLLEQGVQRIYVSHESGDVIFADHSRRGRLKGYSDRKSMHELGTRDSFMAALIWAYMQEMGIKESARAALAADYINAECARTVNEEITVEKLTDALRAPGIAADYCAKI